MSAVGSLFTAATTESRAIAEIARKEFMQHMRTKRVLVMASVMAVVLFSVTLMIGNFSLRGIDNHGTIDGNAPQNFILSTYFALMIVGGLSFTILLAIILTSDAVCSEWSSRTIFLLLSKPVSRTAFVMGKYLGNIVTIATVIGVLFTANYLFLIAYYPGSPSGAEWGGFILGMLLVTLGAAAFASIALFFSSLFRTTLMSMLVTLALWILIFPLLGNIGFFSNLEKMEQGNLDFFEYNALASVDSWRYLNPAADMQAVATLLVPHDHGDLSANLRFLNLMNFAPENVGLAVFWLLAYCLVFLAASVVMVQRRNFD